MYELLFTCSESGWESEDQRTRRWTLKHHKNSPYGSYTISQVSVGTRLLFNEILSLHQKRSLSILNFPFCVPEKKVNNDRIFRFGIIPLNTRNMHLDINNNSRGDAKTDGAMKSKDTNSHYCAVILLAQETRCLWLLHHSLQTKSMCSIQHNSLMIHAGTILYYPSHI